MADSKIDTLVAAEFAARPVPETQLYAVLVGPIVVAKRAAGPDENKTMPEVPAEWVVISEEQYRVLELGSEYVEGKFLPPSTNDTAKDDPIRPDTPAEALWRQKAVLIVELRALRKTITDLTGRVKILEGASTQDKA